MNRKEYFAQRRLRMITLGLCQCGKQPQPGKRTCSTCDTYHQQRRARFIAAGLCLCGHPPQPGRRQCVACSDRIKTYGRRTYPNYRRAWRQSNREKGLCLWCSNQARALRSFCGSCAEKQKLNRLRYTAKHGKTRESPDHYASRILADLGDDIY